MGGDEPEVQKALSRFQDAIAAGVDPTALVEAINKAKAQRAYFFAAAAAIGVYLYAPPELYPTRVRAAGRRLRHRRRVVG